ncbi:MAG: hypothetical protein LBP75_07960 [Planctomycetota bacterium]|jgi:type II secretory pathway component PulM|nr:hypothetical protein [Planctomycetota bacterium]
MQVEFWAPLWRGGLLTGIFAGLAAGMFFGVYQPAREKRESLELELRETVSRQQEKEAQIAAMRQKAAEIERGDPETVKEVMRVEIRKGAANEFSAIN